MYRRLAALLLLAVCGIDPARAGPAAAPDSAALRDEAFEAAQRAAANETAATLHQVAARFRQGSGPIADLEREHEARQRERVAAERRYLDLLANGGEGLEAARQQRDRLTAALVDIEGRIERADPSYFELTRPTVSSLPQIQSLLGPDEALLFIFAAPDATYLFAATKDRAQWARTESLDERTLATLVTTLRRQIDADIDQVTPASRSHFDAAIAYRLYQGLVAPVEETFGGRHVLMVVASGPLANLPLQLLPARPPTEAGGPGEGGWLIDRYALAVLPAVSSLRALRCLLVPAAERSPACGREGGRMSRPRTILDLAGVGAPVLAPPPPPDEPIDRSAPPFPGAFNGELADTDVLRTLESLPGAATELADVRDAFGTGRARIWVGAEATETLVKTSPEVAGARFVIFSTHGLLAGESTIRGEPGLVFTPPQQAARSTVDDGLLTASEAARLHIAAELVVLSACNTAASDGSFGAEGLSGLAKAFLFAGAHALLVSHWRVNDVATARLMRQIFSQLSGPERLNRAIVVQQAVRNLRDAYPNQPAAWAPFVFIGTGD